MTDLVARQSTTLSTGFTFTPTNFEEAFKFASVIAKTEMVPKHFQGKPDAIVVAMAWSAELGVPVMQGLQGIAVINGRPSVWGDLALSMVMKHPSFEDCIEYWEGDGEQLTAVCIMKRKGKEDKIYKFGVADARKANLLTKDGPWKAYPKRMMQMRARAFAMRDQFPDALRGMNLAEESQDIEEKDITPKASVTMPKSKSKASTAGEKQEVQEAVQQEQAPQPEIECDPETGEVIPPVGAKAQEPQMQEGAVTLSENQLRVVRAQLQAAGISETKAAEQFLYDRIEQVPAAQCNAVLQWIAKNKVQS